jgi:hypothetical protein
MNDRTYHEHGWWPSKSLLAGFGSCMATRTGASIARLQQPSIVRLRRSRLVQHLEPTPRLGVADATALLAFQIYRGATAIVSDQSIQSPSESKPSCTQASIHSGVRFISCMPPNMETCIARVGTDWTQNGIGPYYSEQTRKHAETTKIGITIQRIFA